MSSPRQFRGIRVDNREWVYGWYLEHPFSDNPTTFVPCIVHDERPYQVMPETVGQYTGLTDKNGKDLDWWEDDLLRKGSNHPNAPIGIVAYREQDARWSLVSKSGNEFCTLGQAYKNGWNKIGNRHQKPDLLETDKCL